MTDSVIKHLIKNNGGNFQPNEFLDDRDKLDREIIEELVRFRNWCGFPIQITSAYRETGSHVTGKAIDFIMWADWKKNQPSVSEIWHKVTTWPFLGVGVYMDWEICDLGVHVDVITTERQRPLRWMRVDGEYFYQSTIDGLFYMKDGRIKTIQQFF